MTTFSRAPYTRGPYRVNHRELTYLQSVRFLRASREEEKMSLAALAETLEIPTPMLVKYESERVPAPADIFYKWAKALGCRVRLEVG